MSMNETRILEQLFLDFTIQGVLQRDTNGFPVVDPWASDYVSALGDGRFGDAVWARYHIAGDVHDVVIEGTGKPVLEMIEEDALGYRLGDPDIYAEALSFYANSVGDGHPEVLEIITRMETKM